MESLGFRVYRVSVTFAGVLGARSGCIWLRVSNSDGGLP